MVSRIRWLVALTVFTGAASAAPVPVPDPAKYEPPTATVHTLPGKTLLADVKAVAKLLGGDELTKDIDETWAGFFGKTAAPALDLARPVAGYLYLRENVEQSCGVLVIPTTTEKDALVVLEKMDLRVKAEPGKAGRYKLQPPDDGFPVPLFAQFADGGKLLYISINAKPDVLDKDKLIPVAKLVDPKATQHVTVTAYPDRVPNGLRQMLFEAIDLNLMADLDRLEQRKPRDMPPSFPSFAKEALKLGKRTLGSLFTECEKVTLGWHLNTKTTNLEVEYVFTPKSNTPFAKDVAAIKAPVGRFHQLTTKESVLGGWAVLPTPLPKELRATGGAFLKEWIDIAGTGAPKKADPLFAALGDQVQKAVSSGKVDGGFGLIGPNKGGLYTGVAAVAMDDTKDVEKAFRVAAEAAAEFIKLDAAKVGGVAVHEVTTTPAQTPDLVRVFGEDFKLLLAFGKDAVYAAAGPDAASELKRAMALKPTAATVFDLTAHASRTVKLLPPNGFNGELAKMGSRIPAFISYVGLDIAGGKELRVSAKTGMLLAVFLFGIRTEQKFQAVPGGIAPPIKKK